MAQTDPHLILSALRYSAASKGEGLCQWGVLYFMDNIFTLTRCFHVGGATGRDCFLIGLSPLKGKQQLFPLRIPEPPFLAFGSLCFSITKGWIKTPSFKLDGSNRSPSNPKRSAILGCVKGGGFVPMGSSVFYG